MGELGGAETEIVEHKKKKRVPTKNELRRILGKKEKRNVYVYTKIHYTVSIYLTARKKVNLVFLSFCRMRQATTRVRPYLSSSSSSPFFSFFPFPFSFLFPSPLPTPKKPLQKKEKEKEKPYLVHKIPSTCVPPTSPTHTAPTYSKVFVQMYKQMYSKVHIQLVNTRHKPVPTSTSKHHVAS